VRNLAWIVRIGLLIAVCAVGRPGVSEVRAIGRFKDWRVYTETVGRDLVCYAATTASDAAPKDVQHGEVNFFVATWRSGAASSQPSLKVGYDLRSDIAPQAIIGRDRFRLFAAGKEAFASDQTEKALLAALKKGSELRIEAASTKPVRTAYHFSLKGSTEAIDRARTICR